jgi:argininosuccinate lyase
MSDLLWQKDGVAVDARVMRFLAGDDVVLDREFFMHDIAASKVHVEGLARIGVVELPEASSLIRELDALADDFSNGRFVLDERYEDGHSAIEARLIERLGDVGRKVHTGRSRNDQILVATRLWLKAKLATLKSPILGFFGALDQSIPVDSIHAFEKTLKELGKSVEIHIYPGANHAFANPSGTAYNAAAAEDSWKRTKAFYKKYL